MRGNSIMAISCQIFKISFSRGQLWSKIWSQILLRAKLGPSLEEKIFSTRLVSKNYQSLIAGQLYILRARFIIRFPDQMGISCSELSPLSWKTTFTCQNNPCSNNQTHPQELTLVETWTWDLSQSKIRLRVWLLISETSSQKPLWM
jgi:hypothetical protein